MRRLIAFAVLALSTSLLGQTTGAPLNLALPNVHAPNWNIPLNTNFTTINSSYALLAPKANPVFTGVFTIPVTGSIQCLHASAIGVVTGTGADCGSGGGGGFPIVLGSTSIASGSTTTSLAGLTVNGVVLNAAGSSSLFLNQAGAYSAPTDIVTSVFTRTGDVTAQAGDYSAFYLPISTQLPVTITALAHNFLTSYASGTGLYTQAQPSFADISGTATPSQLPLATTSAFGAVKPDGTSITVSAGVISATASGTGTVTHTVGPLTAQDCMIGNGAADSKVDSNCSLDGSGNMNLVSLSTGGPTQGVDLLGVGTGTITLPPSTPAGYAAWIGATTGTLNTFFQMPSVAPTAGQVMSFAVPATLNGQTQSVNSWVTPGLTANPLSQFASTTSAQLAGVISDETGSGKLFFATSGTFLGTPDASGATQFKMPVAAAFASAANGELGYDTTNLNWHIWDNAADSFIAVFPVASPPTSGNCVKFLKTTNTWTLADAGGTCTTSAGDSITSPNSTLAVGGTPSATTLDLLGAAGKIMAGATPALTFTPSLGVDNTNAGTISTANGSANAHTTWGSAATTSNTILGFATAPVTGDLASCTTSSTICTLTDSGVLAANVVTQTGNASSGSICTYTGTNKICVPATALPNGITATTQSQNNNSTAVGTTAYTDLAVANAIAGVNPAVAVLAASTTSLTGTYVQVGGGIGDTFTVTATGAFTLDGIAINTIGQRVLLKNQGTASQNGVYTATIAGTTGISPVFTRALDYDTPSDVNNTGTIPVQSGTVNSTTSWLLTSQVTSIGSSGSSLTYAQFSYNPVNIALLNAIQSWTALQTFGANISIASTTHGVLLSEGASAVVATALGGANFPLIGQGSADPIFSTIAYPTSSLQGGLVYGSTTAALAVSSAGAAKQVALSGGTGAPTFIDFPERYFIPAANCNNTTAGAGWSIPSGGTVTCRAGTNNLGGYITITDTSSTFAQFMVTIPADWDSSSRPFISFYVTSGSDTTNGHTIIPQIKVSCPTAGNGTVSDDATFSAAQSSGTITFGASAVANGFYNGSTVQIGSTQMTGCIAGGFMIVQVGRATDTATGNINFYGADITFPRLLAVQAN